MENLQLNIYKTIRKFLLSMDYEQFPCIIIILIRICYTFF